MNEIKITLNIPGLPEAINKGGTDFCWRRRQPEHDV